MRVYRTGSRGWPGVRGGGDTACCGTLQRLTCNTQGSGARWISDRSADEDTYLAIFPNRRKIGPWRKIILAFVRSLLRKRCH